MLATLCTVAHVISLRVIRCNNCALKSRDTQDLVRDRSCRDERAVEWKVCPRYKSEMRWADPGTVRAVNVTWRGDNTALGAV